MLEARDRPTVHRPGGPGPRRLIRLLGAVLAASALAVLVLGGTAVPAGAVPVSTRVAAPFVPVAGPVFGDPNAAHNAIMTRLFDNIAHTPPGATIQIVGYSFSMNSVATALLAAHGRGVNVQVVMNGHSRIWSPARRMVPALGTDTTKGSFFVLTRGSARGTGGVTHQKSWTFSRVGATPDVVMVGSTNLTGYGTEVQWSDTYVYTARPDVYGVYRSVFEIQKLDRPVVDPFVSDTFARGAAYFFPRPGSTSDSDPTAVRIRALPANASTTVRVAQFAWYGYRGMWLARDLAALKRAGADVSVVAGESVSTGVRSVLGVAGVPIYSGRYAHGKRIHDKLMLASYWRAGRSHRVIWTGSDNWADDSFTNDDDVLQIDDDVPGYRSYVRFFNLLAYPAGGGAPPPPATPVLKRTTTVSMRLTHVRAHLRHQILAYGGVRPDFLGRRVELQRHRADAPGWHTVVTSARLQGPLYRLLVPTELLGSWRLRILVRTTASAKTGRSRVLALRVVR